MAAISEPITLDSLRQYKIGLPVCPKAFNELTELLNRGGTQVEEVLGVIDTEPMLTAQVLRVANSAMYGVSQNVRSMKQAVIRLGYAEIGRIAAALLAKQMFSSCPKQFEAFNQQIWTHSLRTALIARYMGASLNESMADAFYTAGLLHDFGKLILQQVDPEAYQEILVLGEYERNALVKLEYEHFGTTHAKLGAELLAHWKLPHLLTSLVLTHHDPVAGDDHMGRAKAFFILAHDLLKNLDRCGDFYKALQLPLPQDHLELSQLSMSDFVRWKSRIELELSKAEGL